MNWSESGTKRRWNTDLNNWPMARECDNLGHPAQISYCDGKSQQQRALQNERVQLCGTSAQMRPKPFLGRHRPHYSHKQTCNKYKIIIYLHNIDVEMTLSFQPPSWKVGVVMEPMPLLSSMDMDMDMEKWRLKKNKWATMTSRCAKDTFSKQFLSVGTKSSLTVIVSITRGAKYTGYGQRHSAPCSLACSNVATHSMWTITCNLTD